MNIKTIIKKILGLNRDSIEEAKKYWYEHGFTSGENFACYSAYAVDGNLPWLVSVGDNVTLASNVRLLAHDASTVKGCELTKIGIVEVGNNVFIGADSIVLCNTRIGDNVVIGAGSVVTRDIPSNCVYAGNPAKFVCTFDEFKERHLKNLESHPICTEHQWYEWPSASKEEWAAMREKLKDTYGYF